MVPNAFFGVAALLMLAAGRAAPQETPDGQCAATGECSPGVRKAPASPYYWPMARGPIGSHATSPYKGPRDLASSLKWSYDRPEGKFAGPNSNGSPLIDDKKNIYAMFGWGVHKFSPDGRLLWEYWVEGGTNDIPALFDGLLYVTAFSGHVVAVDMETGRQVWKTKQVCTWREKNPARVHFTCDCKTIGPDIASLSAHGGVVTFKTHMPVGGGACKVMGLNASSGEFLWDYATDHMVWNYYPMLTEDGGSVVFQDSTGSVYRLGLDGTEIWKAGTHSEPWYKTWTDGGVQIGPNGVVYAMKAVGGHNVGPGHISAYRVSDGKHLWTSPYTPEAPNAWPVIGRMRKDDPLTVIAPSGKAGGHDAAWEVWAVRLGSMWQSPFWSAILKPVFNVLIRLHDALGDYAQIPFSIPSMQAEVWGLDAETGQLLWKWLPPVWRQGKFRGENKRILSGGFVCIPNPVGNPTLDANGNLYIGVLDGFVYHLTRDSSGPGVKVQSKFDAEGAFSNGGVSLAPGMMVIVSCDTVLVFRGEE
mmetsp:Transcript_4338/g.13262  ORF Transcript_4338/g.13262 Transcript_4338/m.13262 type:complete len:530 (+) Transcript_4338:109-1698(+)